MKGDKKSNFPPSVKRMVRNRSGSRCERCGVDLGPREGEYHHIVPVVFGGGNGADNCSLLCSHCHSVAPNAKDELDLLIYRRYFLRFSSFKEAARYYGEDTKLGVYVKCALELSEREKNGERPSSKR
ncbi:MAG: HNH endonuclease signature motif containing protein [Candidatus Thermoplasmatota archaeon]|nr:HNH endonuclease signature motif containing protein [Candidatus Thermoplasmatota archaeon]